MAKSIRIESELWRRVEEHAATAGYSSAEEFVQHLLERELASAEQGDASAEAERRLRGLGYLE